MTRQWELIFEIIREKPVHLSAEEIYLRAKEIMPSIAMGTVYRNLGQMVGDGLIRRVTVPNGPDRYDRTPTPHAHLVCVRCGKTDDLPKEQDLTGKVREWIGEEPLSYELTVFRLCRDCR